MKHARKDYDRIQDPENKIPENEPVLLLRAQDELAADVAAIWAALYELRYGKDEIADLVKEQAHKMKLWPKKKKPDLVPHKIE